MIGARVRESKRELVRAHSRRPVNLDDEPDDEPDEHKPHQPPHRAPAAGSGGGGPIAPTQGQLPGDRASTAAAEVDACGSTHGGAPSSSSGGVPAAATGDAARTIARPAAPPAARSDADVLAEASEVLARLLTRGAHALRAHEDCIRRHHALCAHALARLPVHYYGHHGWHARHGARARSVGRTWWLSVRCMPRQRDGTLSCAAVCTTCIRETETRFAVGCLDPDEQPPRDYSPGSWGASSLAAGLFAGA